MDEESKVLGRFLYRIRIGGVMPGKKARCSQRWKASMMARVWSGRGTYMTVWNVWVFLWSETRLLERGKGYSNIYNGRWKWKMTESTWIKAEAGMAQLEVSARGGGAVARTSRTITWLGFNMVFSVEWLLPIQSIHFCQCIWVLIYMIVADRLLM